MTLRKYILIGSGVGVAGSTYLYGVTYDGRQRDRSAEYFVAAVAAGALVGGSVGGVATWTVNRLVMRLAVAHPAVKKGCLIGGGAVTAYGLGRLTLNIKAKQ